MEARPAVVRRFLALPDLVQDALLAVLLTAVALIAVLVQVRDACRCEPGAPPVALVLLGVQTLPLVARRRHPVIVWIVTGIAAAVYGVASFADPPLPFGALVGVYSVAAHARPTVAVRAAAVTAAVVLVALLLDLRQNDLADWTVAFLTIGAAWAPPPHWCAASPRPSARWSRRGHCREWRGPCWCPGAWRSSRSPTSPIPATTPTWRRPDRGSPVALASGERGS